MEVQTSGLVERIKVGYDFGFVWVKSEEDAKSDTFIIWLTFTNSFIPDPGEFGTAIVTRSTARLLQSMQLALLREALCKGLRVTITHEESGGIIHQVALHNVEPDFGLSPIGPIEPVGPVADR